MILQNDEQSPANGALVAGQGGHWRMFPAPTQLSILGGGPNINKSGDYPFDLVWLGAGQIPPLQIAQVTTTLATVTTANITTLSAGTGAFTGPIAANGATPPTQAAFPGTAAGTDAVVINKIVAILVGLGFCAAS
jgi:hypothetical protein